MSGSYTNSTFRRLVFRVLNSLWFNIRKYLANIDVAIQMWPSSHRIENRDFPPQSRLLDLYEGIPKPERCGYNWVLSGKVTMFQGPIEALCDNRAEVIREIRPTVIHEIIHYFGIGDH